jgi:hypothetical protein
MVVEGLYVLISRGTKAGLLLGIEVGRGLQITHMQFADDSLFFIPNDVQSLLNTKRTLRWFCKCCSLRVNFHKSFLVGINVDEAYTVGLSNLLFCKFDSLPFKYLGYH